MTGFIGSMITDPNTVAVFLGVLIVVWVLYPRKKFRLPPGPTNWPVIGATIELMRSKHGLKIFQQFLDWSQKYGSIIRVKWIMGDMIIINEINEATDVTRSSDMAGRMHFHTMDIMTDGRKDIGFADYSDRVKYQRRIAGSALRNLLLGGRLETLVHASVEKGMKVFRGRARSKEAFDPRPLLTLQVYNVICAMCFDKNFELEDEEFQTLYKANSEATDIFSSGLMVDVFPPARYLPRTKAFKRVLELLEFLSRHIIGEVQKHKASFDPDNLKDFIDHMLKVEKEAEDEGDKTIALDEVHYKQMVHDIFLAGSETTSSTLLWILFLLAEFPDVQSKVQEEIDEVVGLSRLPGTADKPKMPYSEAVMYECMRFATTVPLGVPHRAMCDTSLGGYDIPKDTIVMINHHALHRDPKEWKYPNDFNPSNFLNENGELLKPRSFLPFGSGKRACLGEAIARPEVFMIYTALLQRFGFRFEEGRTRDLSFQNKMLQILPQPYKVIAEERQ
ncbi:cytochrome P450 2C42-like [Lineus longissimus]|uniref:cytochrome P450 2C42-like n=1 Tax=Lineus longissimus TaxID=88925 RepID=UPI002B4DAB29